MLNEPNLSELVEDVLNLSDLDSRIIGRVILSEFKIIIKWYLQQTSIIHIENM